MMSGDALEEEKEEGREVRKGARGIIKRCELVGIFERAKDT